MNLNIRKVYRKAYRAIRYHGLGGILRLAVERLTDYSRKPTASGTLRASSASGFDTTWHVQTDGIRDLLELDLAGTNCVYGAR